MRSVVRFAAAVRGGGGRGLAARQQRRPRHPLLGAWRVDVSLNLFVLVLVGICFVHVTAIQALRRWSACRGARASGACRGATAAAQAALREALSQYFGGRYSRAHKAAQRAVAIQAETPELAQDNEFTVLGHLLAAGSAASAAGPRAARRASSRRRFDLPQRSPARARPRRARACWPPNGRSTTAMPPRALELLAELPPGVARRTQALRLKLQAARLGRQPQEALKTARLLAKHQGFSKVAAQRPAALAGVRGARHARTTSISCAASGAARRGRSPRSVRRRARRDAARWRSAPPRRRAAGCGRSGSASPSSAPRSAPRSREALVAGRAPASAPNGCRGSRPRCNALPRDGGVAWRRAAPSPSAGLWGKARQLLEQAAERRDARGRAAPRGLARARRAGRARRRRRPRRHLPTRPPRGWADETRLLYCTHCAAVAQLDRVLGYEPRGRGFDSCQPHHIYQGVTSR